VLATPRRRPRGRLPVAITAQRQPTDPILVWRHRSTRLTACPSCLQTAPAASLSQARCCPALATNIAICTPPSSSARQRACMPKVSANTSQTSQDVILPRKVFKGSSNVTRCPITHSFAQMQPGGQQTMSKCPASAPSDTAACLMTSCIVVQCGAFGPQKDGCLISFKISRVRRSSRHFLLSHFSCLSVAFVCCVSQLVPPPQQAITTAPLSQLTPRPIPLSTVCSWLDLLQDSDSHLLTNTTY
jgi:hypothetical protein